MKNENQNSEIKVKEGFCDICGTQETASEKQLENRGWFIGSREHFCPNCNK